MRSFDVDMALGAAGRDLQISLSGLEEGVLLQQLSGAFALQVKEQGGFLKIYCQLKEFKGFNQEGKVLDNLFKVSSTAYEPATTEIVSE